MYEKKSSKGSKKEGLYEALFQSLDEHFGDLGGEDLEARLRKALEEEEKFSQSLEGLTEEERVRRIGEREEQRRKEDDKFIRSLEEDLKNPNILPRDREILETMLRNLKRVREEEEREKEGEQEKRDLES